MSLSRASLCERAWLRNQSRGAAAAIPLARYDALVTPAMTALAHRLAEQGSDLLKKDFSLTVTAGVASLTTPLTASEPMLLDSLMTAKITSADSSQSWQPLPDYMQLSLERPTYGLIFFTVDGTSLIATDTTGALNTLSTTAIANTYFVPLVSTLSGNLQLEEMGIEELSSLAAGMPEAQEQAA